MKILAIDVGKTGGWYFSDEENGEIHFTSLADYEKTIKNLIDLYKPEIVVSARPTRFYRAIVNHSRMLAIVELVCEKKGVQCHTNLIDSTCKKIVLGKGNAKKPDIIKWAGEESEHVADAKMFTEYAKITFTQKQ